MEYWLWIVHDSPIDRLMPIYTLIKSYYVASESLGVLIRTATVINDVETKSTENVCPYLGRGLVLGGWRPCWMHLHNCV